MNFDKFKFVDEKVYKKEQKVINKERKALEKEKKKLEKKIEAQPTGGLFKKHQENKNNILNAEYEALCKKIDELNKRQQELDSEKKENNKRLFRLLGLMFGVLAIIILIGVIISSVSSKNEEHTTSPITDDYVIEEYSEDTTTTTEPEETLEEITLTPSHDKWSVEIDETDDYISYSVSPYLIADEIESYELKAQVDKADVLDAEILIEYSTIHLRITGKKAGKAIVTITGKDGKVTSDELSVVVREPEPETETEAKTESNKPVEQEYVLNTNTKKIHTPYCSSLSNMNSSNKREVVGTIDEFKAKGYSPCQRCNPN